VGKLVTTVRNSEQATHITLLWLGLAWLGLSCLRLLAAHFFASKAFLSAPRVLDNYDFKLNPRVVLDNYDIMLKSCVSNF